LHVYEPVSLIPLWNKWMDNFIESIMFFTNKFLSSRGAIIIMHVDDLQRLKEICSFLESYHMKVCMKWFVVNSSPQMSYRDLNLGLTIKARFCKSVSQEWSWEPHFMLSKFWESVREWTPTFWTELPFGSWSPDGLLSFQRAIVGAKTHWVENFFISLKSSWNLDV